MKRIITLFFLTFSIVAHAKVYNPDNLPVDRVAITYSRVINPDGILNRATISAIDSVLLRLEKTTGVQALIIAITNIEGDDPFQFTLDVFNKYGIGGKSSTGFVLTLATDDRSYSLITGEGLEGSLPDAICRRIQNRVMVPRLKEGDWNSAMLNTVVTVAQYVEGDETLREAYGTEDGEDPYEWLWAIAGIFGPAVLVIALLLYIERRKKKCKKCGKHKMKKVKTETQNLNARTVRYTETWVCSACGNVETRQHTHFIDNDFNGSGGGFGGGMPRMGGGRSMGSFGGFGGGHSFGGGSSGRF